MTLHKDEPLELRIARRLKQLSGIVPHHKDAFLNHVAILMGKIENGHDDVRHAVMQAAIELGMKDHEDTVRVLKHIEDQRRRYAPLRRVKPATAGPMSITM